MAGWIIAGVLGAVCAGLIAKILIMRKSTGEILAQLEQILSDDTNAVIGISSSDRKMRELTAGLDRLLRKLRHEQIRYLKGDRELKEAVTNISHDLRTPLTAIMGYLEVMKQTEKSPELENYLKIIEGRAEAMRQLTEELFRYSVILSNSGPGEPEETVINTVLEECVIGYYGALSERGIEPEVEICEEKVIRSLDRAALARVFGNLMNNALKYSAGDLRISLVPDGTVTFANYAPDLTKTQIERLFDRFYTVEAGRSATGLGLSIARTLIEQMGGSITAELKDSSLVITVRP
ncbi:MAG: HAMP domain-containing histidine kinase [Ruminococcus sp.]|nr:HAMP domain-containing histidine kinase [Ruminococcus sp.]